jgi:hypothetical protein
MTGEELKKRNVDAMGEVAGKQYSLLNNEVAILHLYWNEYVELFSTNQKRVDRLNRTAPGFFRMLQTELFQTNILHLARLTDPSKTGNKENLSLQNLAELVTDASLKKQLTDLLAVAATKTEFARDWRNRRFAHHDLALATNASAIPLQLADKEKFNEALKALADVINAVEAHYFRNHTAFDMITGNRGAATLLYVLGDGVKAQERRRKAIEERRFDDLDNPEQI